MTKPLKKAKSWLLIALACGLVPIGLLAAYLAYQVQQQGVEQKFWRHYKEAKVEWDNLGIPTISAPSWEQLFHAQGFVTASDRLWQMDLIRRKAAGRLSEWFGEKALAHDISKQTEDRLAIVQKAVSLLPVQERQACEAYASGVNQFISQFPKRWGIEYMLLRLKPEPWQCADSLLVLIEMAEQLTASYHYKINNTLWVEALPADWARYIFTQSHPWNVAFFAPMKSSPEGPRLPPSSLWLPKKAITKQEEQWAQLATPASLGSNNWAYRGSSGNFLANDPHLSQAVPGIWYASRLRVDAHDWVVGAGLPGLPGVILGMNPYLAWAITNTGEDVDDLIAEEVNEAENTYLDYDAKGQKVWKPLIVKVYDIYVKGEVSPRKTTALFTAAGPVRKIEALHQRYFSRRWLALQPDRLRLPIPALIAAKDWQSFNTAVDGFTLPAQNLLYLDRQGAMGYRASGSGIKRAHPLSLPTVQASPQSGWLGFHEPSERKRFFVSQKEKAKHFLATANERIWHDEFAFHQWSDDDRKYRLEALLKDQDLSLEDMQAIQLDVVSPFRQQLLAWIAKPLLEQFGRDPLAERWANWDGDCKKDPELFYQAGILEDALTRLLLSRLVAHFSPHKSLPVPYSGKMKRAWLLQTLNHPSGLDAFGLEKIELAQWLYRKIVDDSASRKKRQDKINHWLAQHIFVENLPLLGRIFKITGFDQHGSFDTINAQQASKGPSVRIIWDLSQPENSLWSFPSGQSGHLGSAHYDSMRPLWVTNKASKVFPDRSFWQEIKN